MDDRKLLEMAAKAAKIEISDGKTGFFCHPANPDQIWNPLNDDSQALRLATLLLLQIDITPWGASCRKWNGDISQAPCFRHDIYPSNTGWATRRAIVHAAAEIGRSMP